MQFLTHIDCFLLYVVLWYILFNKLVKNTIEVNEITKILTIKEDMKILKISSYNTFKRNYLAQGLPIIVVGTSKRVDLVDLNIFIENHKSRY